MTLGATIWIALFLIAALLFFGLAAIIAVLGFRDLRLLLSKAPTSEDKAEDYLQP